jgi:hypothetical protein
MRLELHYLPCFELSIDSIVYHIWLQMNCKIFTRQVSPEKCILKTISWNVRMVIKTPVSSTSKNSFKNSVFPLLWGIPLYVLSK